MDKSPGRGRGAGQVKDHGRKHRADKKYHQSLIFRAAVFPIKRCCSARRILLIKIHITQDFTKTVIDTLMI